VFAIPKNTKVLKYVSFAMTGHMASMLDDQDTALYDELVPKHKESLICWPFELVQFAVVSLAHAFHSKQVMCGAVDTTVSCPELTMPLDVKEEKHVLVIGCHEEHYALLEVDTKKRRVIIWESTKYMKATEAVQYWMECILLILRRHFPHELERDYSNVLPFREKQKMDGNKKAWRVQLKIEYVQLQNDERGAVAINQLAWRLKEITKEQAPERVPDVIENPKKLKTKNREKAYELLCYLNNTHCEENIWKNEEDDDGNQEMLMPKIQNKENSAGEIERHEEEVETVLEKEQKIRNKDLPLRKAEGTCKLASRKRSADTQMEAFKPSAKRRHQAPQVEMGKHTAHLLDL
jgi:hypothetical protein